MRLWSLHPAHLDRAGLVACWREALLAQAVLAERTRGYRHHPQLTRFRALPDPLAGIGGYLGGLADEADRRGYRFDRSRIIAAPDDQRIPVTDGQLRFEWEHLGGKLRARSPELAREHAEDLPTAHPLFVVVEGPVEPWERPGISP